MPSMRDGYYFFNINIIIHICVLFIYCVLSLNRADRQKLAFVYSDE